MRAEEWERIKTIFEAALNLAESDREAYLESACGSNAELRRTVSELLANHLEASEFLEDVAFPMRHVFDEGEVVAGRFRIARFISSGGMGEVYEAYDQKLRLRLALKTLRPEFAANPLHLERFQREILVAREVAHESLCRVFDLIEHRPEGTNLVVPCLTMQLLDGETLVTYLKEHKPLAMDEALRLVRQIAGAIETLHDNGLIHRDLKPSNIMVVPEEGGGVRAVVMDFGLAKPVEGKPELFESQVEFQAGAPYFMAPELLRGDKPSVASDIYSLGLLIDEMVTNSRAYPGESVQSLYYQKLWEKPIPPGARAEGLPASWERTILRCLAPEPSLRYRAVRDVVQDLEEAAQPAVAAVPAKPERGIGDLLRRLASTRPGKLALAAFVVLMICGVGSGLLLRPVNTSVMVFPIVNSTNRPDYNYLCAGTTAELMRRMSQLDGVRVIPFYEPRSKAVARLPAHGFSLDGFLQAYENQVRMTVQLTDNKDGALVWAQNFDRELRNPLALQSEIAQGSLQALESRAVLGVAGRVGSAGMLFAAPLRGLFGHPPALLRRPPTTSAAAFDLYIRGRHLLDERSVPAALDAIRCFESALREDVTFALAEAALADAQFVLLDYNHAPNLELLKKAHEHAERAVTLGGDVPETHLSLAATRQTLWDWVGAEESYRHVLTLNPKLSRAHRWYGGFLLQFGRIDEALAHERTAMELDPYDFAGQCSYGLYLFYAGKYPEAIEVLERAIAQKDLLTGHVVLGDVNARLGALASGSEAEVYFRDALRQADIVEAMERRTIQEPSTGPVLLRFADRMHALYYAYRRDREHMAPYLARLLRDMQQGRTSPAVMAWIYAVMGEDNTALDLLERAAVQKDRQLLYLKILPYFENLRSYPRFQAVLRQMNL